MFTFGFRKEQDCSESDIEAETELKWLKSVEIEYCNVEVNTEIKIFNCLGINIKHLEVKDVIDKLKEIGCDAVVTAENLHSDLIPANYEGGLKIWECTKDLLEYLINENINFQDKIILDLGCGLGLLGIYALLKEGIVHFQDYNGEVLTNITIPNVQINAGITNHDKLLKTRYFSGDWASFEELTQKEDKYDIILTSETIYNCNNYKKLHDLFKSRLKKNGTIYLAAKTYYFGVGGGLRQFEDVLKSENVFNYMTCWLCSKGVNREILILTFKNQSYEI